MKNKLKHKQEFRDVGIIALAGAMLFIAASFFHLHALLDKWLGAYAFGFLRLDEFLVVFSFLMFLGGIFYLRRVKDLRAAIEKRLDAEAKLIRLNAGLKIVGERNQHNRAAEALVQARDNLEIRVQKRTFELSRANVELQEQIAKAKDAEAEVRALNKQIEFILGATKTGLDIIDAEYNMRYVDPAWAKIYGDPKGKKCYEYFMGRHNACPECGLVKAFQTKKPVITEEILVKEGNRPIEVTTIPYQDEEGNWLVAEINVDISERKRQEELLKKNEERYRKLIDISPDLISLIDLEGRIIMVNSFGAQLYGYESQLDVIGKSMFEFIAPEEHSRMRRDLKRLMKQGSLGGLEYSSLKRDKTPLYIEASISLLKDDSGVPQSMVLIIRDISARKKKQK